MTAAVEQQPTMNGDVGPSSHADTDSVDKELDWLIEKEEPSSPKETQNGEALDSNVTADGEFIPRNATPEPGFREDDLRPTSPPEGKHGDDPYPRTSPRSGSDSGDEDDYELTEEQREAELLLQKMREEGSLPSEDPPEYDVGERIKQLNEELAKEGEVEEKKDRKVGFKELVEEVPPDDEEEEGEQKEGGENEEKMRDLKINDDQVDNSTQEENAESQNERKTETKKDDDVVVIERNGKFETVRVGDLSPEERAEHGLELVTDSTKTDDSNGHSENGSDSLQPAPPSHPRPATATGSTGSRRKVVSANGNSQRASSAGTQRKTPNGGDVEEDSFNRQYSGYSRYGLTPEQIEYKKEHCRVLAQRRKEQEQKEKEERDRKREEAESAFQAWLEKKREDEKERRKQERERRKQEEENKEERHPEEAYKSWVKSKKAERKKEKIADKHRSLEELEGFYLRSREDCDRAFKDSDHSDSSGSTTHWRPTSYKEWMKKKNSQLRAQKNLSRAHNLRRRLEARRSRKSQNLAKAIRQAQTYKYTDYYGYRY